MKTIRLSKVSRFLTLACASLATFACFAQDYRVLHHFAGGTDDGANSYGSLLLSGSTLYGMTYEGGTNNLGTIFRMNTDGTGFQLLHSFVSGATDGQWPAGPLILSGSTLYGMTTSDGSSYGGTVFQVQTNGSGFNVLHQFSGSEGKWPYGALLRSGDLLYGLNAYSGYNTNSGWVGYGTVFRMDTNGTNFQLLHTFTDGPGDGSYPHGSLVGSDSTFYSMTSAGGTNGNGTIFKINADGSNYQLLHSFGGGTNNGAWPGLATLTPSGSTLYGTTSAGGTSGKGTLFKIDTNGTGFTLLHNFIGGSADGSGPASGATVQAGTMLYGTTEGGGSNSKGAIYEIKTDGTGFQLLHSFGGSDGNRPVGSLLMSGSTLYGITYSGGSNNLGIIYAVDLPLPTLAVSLSSTNVNLSWSTNCPNFTLESTDVLTNAWSPVPGVTGYSATLPVGPVTNQFFRLRK